MSTFNKQTKHPVTGEWEDATWYDDFFGRHGYGVVFPSDEAKVDTTPGEGWFERAKHIAYDNSNPLKTLEESPYYREAERLLVDIYDVRPHSESRADIMDALATAYKRGQDDFAEMIHNTITGKVRKNGMVPDEEIKSV